ncbi:MAG TPA: AmmeMemoRadiSam system protein B [Terriglobales bacterium]|nr:AmmeMemoRadiSam system protein B [Terriglobales bacterium]
MANLIRHPAVAGRFYPLDSTALRAEVQAYLGNSRPGIPALGCMVPHAGIMYSGHVAGSVFGELQIPQRVIVMCPNHTGYGQPLAIMSSGQWETPIGCVEIDSELAKSLMERMPPLSEDAVAHGGEHAVEVELPFLLMRNPRISFVPIALGTAQFETLAQLGNAIAGVVSSFADPILVIASSDMNHYESDVITRVKDHKAIAKILALDPLGLYEAVMREDISMCGFGPAISMLTAVKKMGASKAELVRYATSGDVSGDRATVVGYAGIIVR